MQTFTQSNTIPTKKPRLLLKPELDRILALEDKFNKAIVPIERRLGGELEELALLHGEGDVELPIEKFNEAIINASFYLGELQILAEQIVKTKATAYEMAG